MIIFIFGIYNVIDGMVNVNGILYLIKDGGIYVENVIGKDYLGIVMYV